MTALTANQRAALRFIHGHILEWGWSPSYREIMAALGTDAYASVRHMVDALIRKGFLRRMAGRSRSFEVLRPPVEHHRIAGCPSCGDVIAPEGICPGCGNKTRAPSTPRMQRGPAAGGTSRGAGGRFVTRRPAPVLFMSASADGTRAAAELTARRSQVVWWGTAVRVGIPALSGCGPRLKVSNRPQGVPAPGAVECQ